jgi:undecaprenyl-diphosphatase
MEWLKYIILGIIQGITEVLPISSSGHLTLFSHLLHIDTSNLTVFLMMTNTGSFLAILLFFKQDVLVLFQNSLHFVFKKRIASKDDFLYVVKLVISVIPVGVAGLLLEDYFPNSLLFVGISLIVTSFLLSYVYRRRNFDIHKSITYKNALAIGMFQMFAILPGISRSGITLSGGLVQKLSIKDALKFSFLGYILISIPVTFLGFIRLGESSESIDIIGYLIATVFSFIFSYVSVKWLYKFVKVKNLLYFSLYCLCVGVTSIIVYLI